ncbi:calcineurin-like phosphoesterase [Pectobacterium phage PEAT2]|uniref:Calcineurin-like phosphoesterase n=1 Tax=Pectobacterium phage PEAT2 TaxID=2053078 RepID=A0A2H4N7B5_9CAUD|nr:DNA repair exonuclease [Pectobacterium phage PEAT2]ATV25077.1 calcineurin-like phosphoesterase [Pectobacterium phage PEAT2]
MSTLTEEQLLADVAAGMSGHAIAKKYDMTPGNINRRIKRLGARGLGHGGNVSRFVPDGYKVKGTSSLVKEDGTVALQWVKTDVDAERQMKMMQEAIAALTADIKPVKLPGFTRHPTAENLCNLYTVSDFHLGMLACLEESGEDWDIKIAEDMFVNWFSAAVEISPWSHTAVVSLLGDLMHSDSLAPVTPASGHVLDADSRYFKMIQVTMRMVRRAIEIIALKHPQVHIVVSQGNHDETGMLWLTSALEMMYGRDDRVTVDTSPDVFKMFRHGDTVLFFHHGHKVRFDSIESVMISRFRRDYGETSYAYAHVGHLHHQKIVESNCMVVEQHRTLAAKDAYAARGGWFSGRSANVITYHKQYGEVSRQSISPEMLK